MTHQRSQNLSSVKISQGDGDGDREKDREGKGEGVVERMQNTLCWVRHI